jgi:hypothetical protein
MRDAVPGVTAQVRETCRIAWWKGYVKGRFVALAESELRAPEVVAESPPIRWRGSGPPEPIDAAATALDALTERLVDSGWIVDEQGGDAWFERVLTRSATVHVPADPDASSLEARERASAPAWELRDSAAVALLQTELVRARDEVERERQLRQAAEQRAPVVRTQPAVAPTPSGTDAEPLRSRTIWIVVEILSAAVAFELAFLVFDSLYAAVVAALTTGAVALGLDSFFAVRSRRGVAAPDATSVTLLRAARDE